VNLFLFTKLHFYFKNLQNIFFNFFQRSRTPSHSPSHSENSSIESGAEEDENSSTEDFKIGGLFIADNVSLEVAANNSSQNAGNLYGSRNKRVYYHRCP
jgi:hypothetical protein